MIYNCNMKHESSPKVTLKNNAQFGGSVIKHVQKILLEMTEKKLRIIFKNVVPLSFTNEVIDAGMLHV